MESVKVERLIGAGSLAGLDFEAVETAARQLVLAVRGKPVAERLNADHSDETGPVVCACGADSRDQRGDPVKDPGSVSGNAAIETAAIHDTETELPPFAQRVGFSTGGKMKKDPAETGSVVGARSVHQPACFGVRP